MSSLNKVQLIGNVGRDPEIRKASNDTLIANISIATSDRWRDKQSGERREKTEWHRVVCFNDNLSQVIQKYVRKGSKLYVEGKLVTRKWTDQGGAERYTTEVVLQNFDGKLLLLDRAESNHQSDNGSQDDSAPTAKQPVRSKAELDDDIPF